MEKMAHSLAQKLGRATNADAEKVAVMAYGLTALIQLIFMLLAALALGLIFGFLPEAMLVFLSVGFLRRLIGGAHSESINGCLIMSIICIGAFSALARYVLPLCGFTCLCIASGVVYITAFVLTYLYAPVDSPNKPVRKPEKIRRLRINAFVVLALFALATAAVLFFFGESALAVSCVWALDLSVLWQVFMLTRIGGGLIRVIDRLFSKRRSLYKEGKEDISNE